ncbi:MAG: hypothetical protein HC906_18040, partial [Bacteroidales bacterium]|nr:hypothetical protein [Bacteroidales bacterium]
MMCKKQSEKEVLQGFSSLYGKTFVFNVEKVSNLPNVQFPEDFIQDCYYTSANEDIQYEIAFSENGQQITIEPGTIYGEKIKESEKLLYYELDEGLFAGGRFLIRTNNGDLEAELTIYGSGV